MSRTSLITAFLVSALPLAAFAHPELQTTVARADGRFVAVLEVPHGCDGEPTTEIDIKLPEGFVGARPLAKPGWAVEIVNGDYAGSHQLDGKPVHQGPVEIRWKDGSLPDEYSDQFTVVGRFSGIPAGTVVPFVMTQHCGAKTVVWDAIHKHGQHAHDLKHPAPSVELVATGDTAKAVFEPVEAGDLLISSGVIKAMTPGQPVGSGFVTIINSGKTGDRLVSIRVDGAERTELHSMKLENNIMTMRRLNDGLAVPAAQTVEMKPGGLHLMLMGVRDRFVAGKSIHMTLTFEKAGAVDLVVPVKVIKPGMDHSKM